MSNDLKSLLAQYNSHAGELQVILEKEKAMMLQDTESEHEQILQQKNKVIQSLQELDSHLHTLLDKENEESNNAVQIADLIAQSTDAERPILENLWKTISVSVKQCKELHSINSAIVNSRLNYLRRSLEVLCYGNEAQTVSYDADARLVHCQSSQGKTAA